MRLLVRIAVGVPIQLNDELGLFARKVSEIGTDGMLTPKLPATQLPVAQFGP